MLSSNSPLKPALAAALLAIGIGISGCTLTPVYGDHGAVTEMHLAYARPETRLEQLVYRDLSARLGESNAPDADTVKVTISKRSVGEFLSETPRPATMRLARLDGTLTLTGPDGTDIFTAERTASASYTTNGQSFSDETALQHAYEEAAHQLAQSFRMVLLARTPARP